MPVHAEDHDHIHDHEHTQEVQETTNNQESQRESSDTFFTLDEASADVQEVVFYCDKEEHFHTEECFDTYKVLICENQEEDHIHNEDCFKEFSFLICEKQEHIHDENCLDENYAEPEIMIDEEAEEAKHAFEELLHKAINEEDNYYLNCEKTEHIHTADCFELFENLICEKEENLDKESENYHKHSEECYDNYYVIVCEEKEEHTHTEDCISIKEIIPEEEIKEEEIIEEEVPEEILDEEKAIEDIPEVITQEYLDTLTEGVDYITSVPDDLPSDESIDEDTPLRSLSRAPLLLLGAGGIEIKSLVVQMFYGAKPQGGKYVWDANFNTSGHRFSYRINYETTGVFEIDEVGAVTFTIPKQILRDRDNNLSGTYEMSIPSKRDVDSGEELDRDVKFAYYEQGDNIVIYNFRKVSAGENGYIELSYLTNKPATSYKDMGKSDDFSVTMNINYNGTNESKYTHSVPVYINTNAKIKGVKKGPSGYPSRYSSWQTSWGTAEADANNYYYLLWTIRTEVTEPVTQPYNFKLVDTLKTGNGSVVGYRFSGQSTFTTNNIVTNQTSDGYRYDYVLTKHPKSYWQPLTHWEITNSVTATVDPVDQIDADTSATSQQTYVWNKPVFTIPSGHFNSWKKADGWWRALDEEDLTYKNNIYKTPLSSLGHKNGEYSRYDLDEFQDGNLEYLNNLDWAVWMRGYPYPWTYQGSDPKNPDNYGKIPVKFELIDEGFYLWDEAVGLNKDLVLDHNDFQIDTITYEIRNSHVTGFDEENQKYIMSSNIFDSDDILNFYGKFENGDWVKIATYKPLDSSIWFDSNYTESMTASEITLKDNCIAYKVDTTNAHYYTEVNTVPNARLKNSTKVMNFVQEKQSVGILNEQTANFYKNDGSLIVQTGEGDSNYLRVTQKDSYIFKDSVSATNNVKKKNYVITWKVGMTEQYIAGEGEINYINQESGVFYDLLPVGSNLDINSVSVRVGNSSRFSSAVDTAEKMKNRTGQFLPETAFTVEQIPNYKNTGRTLLIVKIKEEAKYYDIFFDTVHSWDSISDWGNDVYNPVAYETGNDKIKYGTNNDGGQISEKQLMSNLPSEAQGEKFIYAEAEFDIATITAASTGLTKKVKALDDKDFSYDTITTNDGDYEYRWRIASSHTSKTKNIILFDSMENYVVEDKASDWHGTLESIDLSQVISMGVNPIVYYSTIENLNIDENHNLTDSNVWQRLTDSTDLSSVKALALDARKKTNGQDFVLEEGQSLTVILHMRAPHGAAAQGTYPEAYNNIYLSDTVIGLNGQPQDFFIHQDYTTVRFVITEDLSLKKLSAEDESTPIKDIKFRLKGTSDYGTEEDRIVATDLKGEIVFKDIEKGSYILSEYEATVDWLLNPAEYVVTVDAEGVVSITGQDNSNFVSFNSSEGKYTLTLKDDPRVHGDVTLLKRREGDGADDIEFKREIYNAKVGYKVTHQGKTYMVSEKKWSTTPPFQLRTFVRVVEKPKGEAYAEVDKANRIVRFFRDEPNKYTDGEVLGSKTYYTNIEKGTLYNGTMYASPKWYSYWINNDYSVQERGVTYIFDDHIYPKANTTTWFSYAIDIVNIDRLHTLGVVDMSYMFYNCKMKKLELTSLDTFFVTSMSYMFYETSLEEIDLSSFETKNLKDLDYMFFNSGSLSKIYVSDGWKLSNAILSQTSNPMFSGCKSLPNFINTNAGYLPAKANYEEDGYLTYKQFELPNNYAFWFDDTIKPQTPISDTTFKLYGVSDYGTETTELGTTNAAGRVTFKNIELGTYTLEEVIPNEDYVLNTTKWTVKIDENGNASIIEPEDENSRDRLYTVEKVGNNYVVFNEPRYWNFTLRKIDKENETIWIQGAEFTLSGISDLGTEYNEVVESNENGRVIFNRIEKGTYILKETKAPTGVTETGAQGGNRNYIADPKEYIVKIDNQGNVTIDGLNMNQYDDFVVKNDRAYDGKITIVKKWEDNLTNDERPEPVVHLSTNEPNWKRGITVTKVWEGDSVEDRPEDITVHLGERTNTLVEGTIQYISSNGNTNMHQAKTAIPMSELTDLISSYINSGGKSRTILLEVYKQSSSTEYYDDPGLYANMTFEYDEGANSFTATGYINKVDDIEPSSYVISVTDIGLFDSSPSGFLYFNQEATPTSYTIQPRNKIKVSLADNGYLYDIYKTSQPNSWTKNPDNTWTYTFDILLEDENADKEFYVWEEGNIEGYDEVNTVDNSVKVENQSALIYNTLNEEAYAVFDSSNKTLTFFRDKSGKYTNGQTEGTKKYYTGIETTQYDNVNRVPWMTSRATTCIFADEIMPISTVYWFYNMTSIIGLEKLNTSNVTDMQYTFFANKASSLDLSSFDTSNVTNMNAMFHSSQATTLDLSSFDTSNVTTMESMFESTEAETLVFPQGFGSNTTNMYKMFVNSQTTTLDLSSFDTSSVTDVRSMFMGCQATSIDLSSFNTSKLTSMMQMFARTNATTLDLRSFDTSNVTDMYGMFSGCQATILDLTSFDTSNVTEMDKMFNNSENLVYIYVSDRWNVAGVYGLDMFYNCINLPNFNEAYTKATKAHYNADGYLTFKYYTPIQ